MANMQKLKLLHISDLHMDKTLEHDQRIVLKALFDDISENVISEGPIDAILFTGDLIGKGKYDDNTKSYLKAMFIDPLLAASGVPRNRLFICPGNHDIDTKKADPYLSNVFSSFKSYSDVNGFIDNLDNHPYYLSQLSSFNECISAFDLATPVVSNNLYRAYEIDCNGIKVGIACANSAWRASGKANEEDYGKLLIGERQIEKLHESISHTELKLILMHHATEYVAPFDRPNVQRAIHRHFDALFHGHNHTGDAVGIATANNGTFISNAGAIYQSRDYFNGYSVLSVELHNAQQIWNVAIREYSPTNQQFAKSSRYTADGTSTFAIAKDSSNCDLIPSTAYLEIIEEKTSSQLLSYAASGVAPKSLHSMFVEPRLHREPEKKMKSQKERTEVEFLSLRELTFSDKPIFFLGPKESGKTTLLNFLCLKANDPAYLSKASHAIYIDVSSILKYTRAGLLEAAVKFCDGEYKKSEVIRLLSDGKMLVCIDNLPLSHPRVIKLISEFVIEFSACKFCFSAEEGIEQSINSEFAPLSDIDTDIIYIHSFNRKQTRELVGRWFSDSPSATQEKVNSILGLIRKLGVPQTPFLISVLLWIQEREIAFSPVNYASIIDTFVDGLLEKLTESKDRSQTDSTIKRHYLMELAYAVHCSKKRIWPIIELERFTVDYFDQKALASPTGQFLNELFAKGILFNLGNDVCFKFDCFRSFFLAQKIDDSKELAAFTLTKEGFLTLGTEIDFYTGLHRNKVEYLQAAMQIVNEAKTVLGFNLALESFDRIELSESILSEEVKERIQSTLFKKRPDVIEQEKMFDVIESRHQFSIETSPSKERRAEDLTSDTEHNISIEENRSPWFNYLDLLKLASMILRNSELVNEAPLKRSMYSQIISLWSEVLIMFTAAIENIDETQQIQLAKIFSVTDPARAGYFMKLTVPNIVFLLVNESLGTHKLDMIIREHIETNPTQVETLVSTFLYSDLALPNFLSELEKLIIRFSSSRFTLELLFFKLMSIYLTKNISDSDSKKIETIVGNVFVRLNDNGSKRKNDAIKVKFIANLQKRSTTELAKNPIKNN